LTFSVVHHRFFAVFRLLLRCNTSRNILESQGSILLSILLWAIYSYYRYVFPVYAIISYLMKEFPTPLSNRSQDVISHTRALQHEGDFRGEPQPFQPNPAEQQAAERLGKPPPLATANPDNPTLATPQEATELDRQERQRGRRTIPPESTLTGELYRGSLIRKLREEKGLKRKVAAAQVGYARSSLASIEKDTQSPSPKKLQKIAELLEVPVEVLEQAPEHPRTKRRKYGAPPRRRGPQESPPKHGHTGELYLGSLIRKLRQGKGLDIEEVAAQVGYARSSLSRIERNYAVPSEEKLQKIAEQLEVPVEELRQAPQHHRIGQTPIEKLRKMSFDELAKHENRLRPKPRFRRL
jgi:transcriptional regulator with XRE-family HTH domain